MRNILKQLTNKQVRSIVSKGSEALTTIGACGAVLAVAAGASMPGKSGSRVLPGLGRSYEMPDGHQPVSRRSAATTRHPSLSSSKASLWRSVKEDASVTTETAAEAESNAQPPAPGGY